MSKQIKTLVALGSLALALIVYLAATSRVEKVKDENTAAPVNVVNETKRPPVDLARLEAEYKSNMRLKIAEAELAIADADDATGPDGSPSGADKLSALKIGLLDLTVPEEFREAHLNFVIALSKVKTAIEQGDAREKAAGVALFNSTVSENQWLKN